MTDFLSLTAPAHRTFRPYTKSGVFRTQLSAPQIRLLEQAGHGGIITGVSWTSMRSMADKGAVEIVEREVHHTRRGDFPGRIISVRVI